MVPANAKALIRAIFRKDLYPLESDPLRFAMEARLHGASPEVYEVFLDSQHPPGISPPFSNKPAGRKRRRRPKVSNGTIAWKWGEV